MRREVDEATRDLVRQLEKRSEEIEKLLDEKRVLSREDRRNIVSTLKNVRQELKSNIPYLQKLFAEQMDKTVTEAKGEFETYLQNKMNSIALAAISDRYFRFSGYIHQAVFSWREAVFCYFRIAIPVDSQ